MRRSHDHMMGQGNATRPKYPNHFRIRTRPELLGTTNVPDDSSVAVPNRAKLATQEHGVSRATGPPNELKRDKSLKN